LLTSNTIQLAPLL